MKKAIRPNAMATLVRATKPKAKRTTRNMSPANRESATKPVMMLIGFTVSYARYSGHADTHNLTLDEMRSSYPQHRSCSSRWVDSDVTPLSVRRANRSCHPSTESSRMFRRDRRCRRYRVTNGQESRISQVNRNLATAPVCRKIPEL